MKSSLNLYQQISYNKRMSTLIIIGFGIFALLLALAIIVLFDLPIESAPVIGAILVALILLQYSAARSMVLGISGARPARRDEYPFIYHTVEGLAIAAGIPTPKCYIIDSPAPNAFATGRNPQEGVIALTTGLIDKLNNEEIEAVIAHEMAHIQNYDIRLATLAIAFIGIVAVISELLSRSLWFGGGRRSSRSDKKDGRQQGLLTLLALLFVIFAPLFANILHLILSRRREYFADATGAFLTRNPAGLANALRKIAQDSNRLEQASAATAPLYIVNPLNKASAANSLFSTHPPIQDRIKILEQLSYKY